MVEALEIEPFLSLNGPIYDVRSPAEYAQGYIPEACNLPLFSNEERTQVGTTYKKCSPEEALLLGLEYVGPKMRDFAETSLSNKHEHHVRLYCWRGGLRSQSMAWLFKTSGSRPVTLKGGYKSFRCWTLAKLAQPYTFYVIGGLTGSGKTATLHALRKMGKQIIDLEALAHHRGSAFGALGLPQQPSNEHFENKIAHALNQLDSSYPIFVEDESRMIGSCKIPDALFHTIRNSTLIVLECPRAERIELLLKEYGQFSPLQLIEATMRLERRLGGARGETIKEQILSGDLYSAANMLLDYYDSSYLFSVKRSQRKPLLCRGEGLTAEKWADKLLEVI